VVTVREVFEGDSGQSAHPEIAPSVFGPVYLGADQLAPAEERPMHEFTIEAVP